ncbi:hypothetical protein [Pelagicoccus sp. SDUM812005]|uniref:hypothetical protein n=1 Tax=Pelagicoccus sp. SDUM812005 TaxID=3041257 RepID=UPI00280E36A9|nr:hypothetical protein [Pelagicoccus sp. SDUM812005]MDQ8182583.1 hypothetical protein [Pelagicoccus sp. SDUM812005]
MKTIILIFLLLPTYMIGSEFTWKLVKEADGTAKFDIALDGGSTGPIFINAEGEKRCLLIDKGMIPTGIKSPTGEKNMRTKKMDYYTGVKTDLVTKS